MMPARLLMTRAMTGLCVIASLACTPAGGGGSSGPDAASDDLGPTDGGSRAQPDAGAQSDGQPGLADPGPPASGDRPRFGFPIAVEDRALIHRALFFGVDHDPVDRDDTDCLGYDGRGFPFCYDGHRGSDFVLAGGFVAMDEGSALVVAAAGGEVVEAIDGHYDRCSGDLENFEPTCDGHPVRSNTVVVAHANGWRTRYLHLMQGSVAVQVGDRVSCGDPLGRVGSSGRSFTPHLHFEVRDPADAPVDPFAGDAHPRPSLWGEQRAEDTLPGPACDPAWGPAR